MKEDIYTRSIKQRKVIIQELKAGKHISTFFYQSSIKSYDDMA